MPDKNDHIFSVGDRVQIRTKRPDALDGKTGIVRRCLDNGLRACRSGAEPDYYEIMLDEPVKTGDGEPCRIDVHPAETIFPENMPLGEYWKETGCQDGESDPYADKPMNPLRQLVISSRHPNKLPIALDAAMRLCGHPQHAYIKTICQPVDHAYLAIRYEKKDLGKPWAILPPGSSADVLAAKLVTAMPDIARDGFLIRMADPDFNADPLFYIAPYYTVAETKTGTAAEISLRDYVETKY